MGVIGQLTSGRPRKEFPGQSRGKETWRQVFGSTHKEVGTSTSRDPVRGNSYGRSLITDPSTKRLIQAMRSMAPGGWSDDRYEQSRHYVGITYAGIHRQNELLTQAEFQVFWKDRNAPDGKREVTPDDPPQGDRLVKPYDLVRLLEKPNIEDSFGDLMANWNLQLDLTGMALTWMVPNQLHTPMELYPIPTSIAIPQPAINPDYPDGYWRIQPIYPYGPFSSYPTPTTAVGAAIPAQWMMRFKYPHPILRYDGYSPQTALRLHLDEIEQMDRSRWYKMKKSINPNAVLQMDEAEEAQALPEPEIERIRTEIENAFAGPENAGNLFVAYPGSRLEEFGRSPVDMDYQAGWDQLVSFALGAGFGITKPAAGMIEDSSYSTLFATLKQLYWLTLEPKASRIAAKLTRFLAPFYGDDLIVEVRCRPIDDHDIKSGKLNMLITAKAITKNELRKELDMAITEEEWGEEIAGKEEQQQQQGMPGQEGAEGGEGQPQGLGAMLAGGGEGEEGEQVEASEEPKEITDNAPKPPSAQPSAFQTEPDDQLEEPREITNNRPQPKKLGRGALGPRMKSLSRYDLVRKALLNGRATAD